MGDESYELTLEKKRIPIGRFGHPQEIASVVELLVTNAYMTNKVGYGTLGV
jgi:3-oxoacyl-[acyl-carrier protein] reductase